MKRVISRLTLASLVAGLLLLSSFSVLNVSAQASDLDPAATGILKTMTAYLASLKAFTVHTQNNIEDELESGHRVDFDVAAEVAVSRPNKLRAKRRGELVDQIFYYDGNTLTLYNPAEKVYATEPAPGTIEELLDYTRESLGLIVPVADIVYRNSFSLLMEEVALAMVVGRSVINGVECDHLLFSRPGVDFQVWVARSGDPLPYKYVVTDTGSPSRLSISTIMSEWNVSPSIPDAGFSFVPPEDAEAIDFMPL